MPQTFLTHAKWSDDPVADLSTTQRVRPDAVRDNAAVEDTTLQSHQRTMLRSRIADNALIIAIHHWLVGHSITLLRISMGAVIFGFGILKYFPGVSPAEDLILATTHLMTFGLMPDNLAIVLTATLECGIGLSLITGWGLRVTIYLLAIWVVGILSPVVLLPGRLFSGPHHAPTLEGQYVLKDIILLTAILVITTTLRRPEEDSQERGWAGGA